MRCKWCGQFIAADTVPTDGYNARGEPVAQLLCATDAEHWRDLTARNLERLARA